MREARLMELILQKLNCQRLLFLLICLIVAEENLFFDHVAQEQVNC